MLSMSQEENKGNEKETMNNTNSIENRKLRDKAYYLQNREKILARNERWRKSNMDKSRMINMKKNRRRRSTSEGRLHDNVSRYMRKCLKGNKAGKSWEQLVGYTVEDLKRHMEQLFTEGMTWEKYLAGEIQLDHKKPIAYFRSIADQKTAFKECWALTNLQPLWKKDNQSKGAKLNWQPKVNIV